MAEPSSATDSGIISLRDLIDFISHVADCYPEITKDFPQQLINILALHHAVLDAELREKIVGSLVLLRKKNILDSTTYYSKLNVRGSALTSCQFASNLLSSSHVNTQQNPSRPTFHQNP
jgi:NUC130/3NT domain